MPGSRTGLVDPPHLGRRPRPPRHRPHGEGQGGVDLLDARSAEQARRSSAGSPRTISAAWSRRRDRRAAAGRERRRPGSCCASPSRATWAGSSSGTAPSTRRSTAGTPPSRRSSRASWRGSQRGRTPRRERAWIAEAGGTRAGCDPLHPPRRDHGPASPAPGRAGVHAATAWAAGWSTSAWRSPARPGTPDRPLDERRAGRRPPHLRASGVHARRGGPATSFGHDRVGQMWSRRL